MPIFYQNLVKHVRVNLYTLIIWSLMRLSVGGFIKNRYLNCFTDKTVDSNYPVPIVTPVV